MNTTLGLDIGTNSIGWCLMNDGKEITDIGVRIFPEGVNLDTKGKEISKNSTRRTARGTRRLYDRYKLRRKQLRKCLLDLGMMPTEEMIITITAPELYRLRKTALDTKITLQEIGRIYLLLNQRRGFKSNKKQTKTEDAIKEEKGIKQQMSELTKKVEDSGLRTLGEYFYSLFEQNKNIKNWHNPFEPVEKIRERFVYRKLYNDEFDAIWNKQKEFYPEILTDDNKRRIKDNCIYYQRPLKSQKHLVAKCRFETNKRVAPKSAFPFQEFRIWQTLSNIRVTCNDRYREFLTIEEKKKLADYLMINKEISLAEIKKQLGLPKASQTVFNELPEKIKGNTTNNKLIVALGKDYYLNLDENKKYKLWHTLFFYNDEERLLDYAKEKLQLNSEQAADYTDIELEPDYSNISVKAINKILPFMKQGYEYAKACEFAGYHHSYEEETDSKTRKLEEKIQRSKDDELRNPLVQQALSETYRLVNAIIAEHGKPDKIRVELARELKKPKKIREQMRYSMSETRKRRDSYVDFLKDKLRLTRVTKSDILKFELWLELEYSNTYLEKINGTVNPEEFRKFAANVKMSDNEKYKLYLECGRISPYTGKVISLERLFSPEIEIEHIIPYSKCMDDSFMNKTICEREFNAEAGNELKALWFKNRPDKLREFIERVKYFKDGKQERFLMENVPDGFLNSQLTNNAYIAREARKKLKTVCRDVYITNGQATSVLRRLWELNIILNPDGTNEKSRDDHRHHAIDALVIANTNEDNLKLLIASSKFDYTGKLRTEHFPMPYDGFPAEAEDKIKSILVSYRNKKRLISKKKNKYVHSKKRIIQDTFSIRGTLHEETLYGQITHPETKLNVFVVKKKVTDITSIKQVNKIVDKAIKEIILAHIETNGGETKIKESLKKPVFIYSKDKSKKIQIKTVRMIDPAANMIQLRPNENLNQYVSSGNNYCIAIYEDPETTKKKAYTISFFEAAMKKLAKKPVIEPMIDNFRLAFTLTHDDLVIKYINHEDEIDWNNQSSLAKSLYRIAKFSGYDIYLVLHNYSNVNPDKYTKYAKGIAMKLTYNTLRAVKVKLTSTGKIIRFN